MMVKTTPGMARRLTSQASILWRSVSGLGVLLSVVALSTSSVVGQQTDSDTGPASVVRTISATQAAATLASLQTIADSTENIAIRTNRLDVALSVRWAREIIDQMSDEELAIYADLQPSLGRFAEILLETEDFLSTSDPGGPDSGDPERMTTGFPDAPYSFCGASRNSTGLVRGFLIAQQVAEGIAVLAQRGCNQTLFGVNITPPCIATDTLFFAAKTVFEGLTFCDADIDHAEVDGFFRRLGHIDDDLGLATSSILANKLLINTARDEILKALHNGLKSITDAIGQMVDDVLDEIKILFNAQNEQLLAWRIYRLQLWIEEDLGREMDEHRIGSFQLPDAIVCAVVIPNVPCGSLDTVDQIVKDTIANMETADMPTFGAEIFVAKARNLVFLGEYKEAYGHFSTAYRLATATEQPPLGACCFDTGGCADKQMSVKCAGADQVWHEALSCEELGEPCKCFKADPPCEDDGESAARTPSWPDEEGSETGLRRAGGRAEGR